MNEEIRLSSLFYWLSEVSIEQVQQFSMYITRTRYQPAEPGLKRAVFLVCAFSSLLHHWVLVASLQIGSLCIVSNQIQNIENKLLEMEGFSDSASADLEVKKYDYDRINQEGLEV